MVERKDCSKYMKGHRRGLTAVLLIILAAAVCLSGCENAAGRGMGSSSDGREAPAVVDVSGTMEIEILDIGKADCTVIRSSGQVAVIDTGYKDTADTVMEYLNSQGVTRIDHLILTHFDKDHVGGAADILDTYDIGTIYQPDYSADEEDSKPYRRYEEALQERGLNPVTVKDTLGVVMDDIVFTIYPPKKLEYEDDKDNNRSLVTTAEHGKVRLLFAGDAEEERIEEILVQIADLDFDLLKVPHHGHMEKNSAEFFEAISPDYAVICADEEDAPDEEAVEALQEASTHVLVTGDGSVRCVSDGKELTVIQE